MFIPMAEDRARKIVEDYRGVQSRRASGDLLVRIEKCEQDEPGVNSLVARVVGFTLHTAQLSKKFFETEASWKKKSLITEWRSAAWRSEVGVGEAESARNDAAE